MAPCSAPSTTLRAGWAGAAARHHGPHLRAVPGLISVGAREWSSRSNERMATDAERGPRTPRNRAGAGRQLAVVRTRAHGKGSAARERVGEAITGHAARLTKG